MKKYFFILLLLVFCHNLAEAVPSISGVSGTVSNGNSIIVSGSGFGATGPYVEIFDDFEGGTNGSLMLYGANDVAPIGGWTRVLNFTTNEGPMRYSADYSRGSLSGRINYGETDNYEPHARIISDFHANSTYVYLQFWVYIPIGKTIPWNSAAGYNFKLMLLDHDVYNSAPYTHQIVSDLPGSLTCLDCWNNGGEADDLVVGGGGGWCSSVWTKGRWYRVEDYFAFSSSGNGTLSNWEMDSNNARSLRGTTSTATTGGAGEEWNFFQLPGYGRGNPGSTGSYVYFDDVYVATGAGARARVEIGNNATYSSCTNLAVITPTSWGDTSITATVRQGSFSSGSAYLFVTDANGVTSSGRAITIASGVGDITPPTLSTKTISSNGTALTLAFNETVSIGTGGNGGWVISPSGGAATLTYASGSGSSSLVYTISRAIQYNETVTLAYTQPTNGVEDTAGNDLVTIPAGSSVTNSSTQSQDTTPTQFTFTDITGATRSTVYTSNTITVAGINSTATVTVSNGTYSKNGGVYTSSAGTAVLGDTFAVRHTSSASYSTAVSTILTIGGVSDTYTTTTQLRPGISSGGNIAGSVR